MIPTAHNLKEPGAYWATNERGERGVVHVFQNLGQWMVEARGAYDWEPASTYFDFEGPLVDPSTRRSLAFSMTTDREMSKSETRALFEVRWCTNAEEFYGFEPGRVTFVRRERDGSNRHVFHFLAHPAALDPERDGVKRGDFAALGIGVRDEPLT